MSIKNEVSICGQICNKCGEYKEWPHYRNSSRYPSTMSATCRDCEKKAYHQGKTEAMKMEDGPPQFVDPDILAGGTPFTKPEGRICTRCGISKPWDSFSKDSKAKAGYRSQCKDCCNRLQKKYRPAKQELPNVIKNGKVKCTKCGVYKLPEEYHKHSQTRTGLRPECINCEREHHKQLNISPVDYFRYSPQLNPYEETRERVDGKLEVKCALCKKWFAPNRTEVKCRLDNIAGKPDSTSHFYCSRECRSLCPVYRKRKYIEGQAPNARPRVASFHLRKLAFEYYGEECEICGSTDGLKVHHIKPYKVSPVEEADVDNLCVLCKDCHSNVHRLYKECSLNKLGKLDCGTRNNNILPIIEETTNDKN